jgi:hypothetical protein
MNLDLSALNSATKYPSIPTYHTLADRGVLTDETVRFTDEVILTEKVDGTNGRIVLLPDGDYFIGSREELLHAKGDRVHNPALGIVDALRPLADGLKADAGPDLAMVFFLEVYGHRIGGAAKQYSAAGNVSHRLFDLAFVPVEVLGWERDRISGWREGGGQTWEAEPALQRTAEVEGIELTPRLGTLSGADLPTGIEAMHAFLEERLPGTLVALDENAGRRPEGIVLRDGRRQVIAKARFQDYERTLKRRGTR